MKKQKKELKPEEKKEKFPLIFDLLRGRVTVYDERVWVQIMYCIFMVAFWTFVVVYVGTWTLIIPGLSNLESLRGRSP